MDCDRVRHLLNGYVDGEIDLVNSLEIEEHLHGCAACSQQYQELIALHAFTSDAALFYPAPAGLERRIRSSLREENPVRQTRFGLSWRRIAPAAGLAVILLLFAAILGRSWLVPNQESAMAEEVQSAHVRSLMASHLTDVASSDQHTVKPWFNGRLDFSPPVADLAAQGFPLIGGRLDYINSQPVAALVYRRNKHYINLFIWPSTDQSKGVSTSTYNGYHLIHWSQSGMTYWAASDLEVKELQTFVQLVQKEG